MKGFTQGRFGGRKRVVKPAPLQTQYWADRTQQVTDAYRGSDGIVRYTLSGYPIKGAFAESANPREISGRRAA